MAKKPLAPLKSMVRVDHAAEVARLSAELTLLESRLNRISRWSFLFLLGGLFAACMVTAVWYAIEGIFVIWGLPAAIIGLGGMGAMQMEIRSVRDTANRMRKQRSESKAMLLKQTLSSESKVDGK